MVECAGIPQAVINGQPLAGQKALVTGANSGIGKAVAIAMAEAGAAVAINYLTDEDAAYAVKDQIARWARDHGPRRRFERVLSGGVVRRSMRLPGDLGHRRC